MATTLPAMTPLVGREGDLERLVALLAEPSVRLVTLAGPGGVGKTRLAVSLMERLAGDFDRTLHFVSLAHITDAVLVPGDVVRSLGGEQRGNDPAVESIAGVLGVAPSLVVLDNAEQVIAAAPFFAALLTALPNLQLLVTSRETLRIRAEHVYTVAPLSVGGHEFDSEAVRLFIARAQAAGAIIDQGGAESETIAAICARLDGLPLAIELAAARSRLLSPRDLLERLNDPLRVLDRGPRDLPDRQRTMRDVVAWSFGLLDEVEREFFLLLSVFTHSAPLTALEEIWADWTPSGDEREVLELVESLIAKSLAAPLFRDGDAEPRFTMLETIREYGVDRLRLTGRETPAREAHADWFLALAEASIPELIGGGRNNWLDRLEQDLPNLRAAHTWAIDRGDVDRSLRFVEGLWRYWESRGHLPEGESTGIRAVRLPGAETRPELFAKALYGAAIAPYRMGHFDIARELAEECLAVSRGLGDPDSIARGLNGCGLIAFDQGDFERAESAHLEGLAISELNGLELRASTACINLGILYFEQGRFDESWELYSRALYLNDESDRAFDRAFALNGLGLVAHRLGRLDEAIELHRAAIEIRREDRDSGALAASLTNLAMVLIDRGDLAEALPFLRESLEFRWKRGEMRGTIEAIAGIARIAAMAHQEEIAARLYGGVRASIDRGHRLPYPVDADLERMRSTIAAVLGDRRFCVLADDGRQSPIATMVEAASSVAAPASKPAALFDSDLASPLTPREIEVLMLIAEGRSDRQIAEVLEISRNTVTRHVSNIFVKLNVNSRTLAAMYAFNHGLASTHR